MNESARKARHDRVFSSKAPFARAASLALPRFAALSQTVANSGQSVRSILTPYLHRQKQEATSATGATNKLFRRYTAVVALIFTLGSINPVGALYGDNYGLSQSDSFVDSEALNASILTDSDGYLTKINPQTDSGDRSTMNDRLIHIVASGETVSTIAEQYGLKSSTLLWENGLTNANNLKVNQQLLIPPVDGITHTVAKGETVAKLAKTYNVDSDAILKQNRLAASTLSLGQEIFIPGATPIPTVDTTPVRVTPSRSGTSSRAGANVVAKADGAILPGSDDSPVGDKPFIYPTRGKLTQGFHAGHYAFDIADRSQPPIWAAGSGKVVKATSGCAKVSYGCGGGYGNHVIIDHGNGLQTLYAHMEYIDVAVGDEVTQNQVIGKMGRSGNVRGATGIHLHFEVRDNGKKKLPSNYY